MGLLEAKRCIAVTLGLAAPAEAPYVHVLSYTELKQDYCRADCLGMYVPLRAQFNGGRYSIIIAPESGANTLMQELTHHEQHVNGQFVSHAGPAGEAESQAKFMAEEWRNKCPQLDQQLVALLENGGTPLPQELMQADAGPYSCSLGARELRRMLVLDGVDLEERAAPVQPDAIQESATPSNGWGKPLASASDISSSVHQDARKRGWTVTN